MADLARWWGRSLIRAAVRFGSGSARAGALVDPYFGFHDNLSELQAVPLDILEERLRKTIAVCAEICAHYPTLERSYRRRRRWLAANALGFARYRLFTSCCKTVPDDNGRTHGSFIGQASSLLAAGALRFWCRVHQQVLTHVPLQRASLIDDICLRNALSVLASAGKRAADLDRIVASIETRRRGWSRMEIFGTPACEEDRFALSQAVREVLWPCPTRMSRLILLSALRDNDKGTYHHPVLSSRFPAHIVNRTLTAIHRDTCEELLKSPLT